MTIRERLAAGWTPRKTPAPYNPGPRYRVSFDAWQNREKTRRTWPEIVNAIDPEDAIDTVYRRICETSAGELLTAFTAEEISEQPPTRETAQAPKRGFFLLPAFRVRDGSSTTRRRTCLECP